MDHDQEYGEYGEGEARGVEIMQLILISNCGHVPEKVNLKSKRGEGLRTHQ